jgi:hypothetical protein
MDLARTTRGTSNDGCLTSRHRLQQKCIFSPRERFWYARLEKLGPSSSMPMAFPGRLLLTGDGSRRTQKLHFIWWVQGTMRTSEGNKITTWFPLFWKGPLKRSGKAIESFSTIAAEPRIYGHRDRHRDETTWVKVDMRWCVEIEEDPPRWHFGLEERRSEGACCSWGKVAPLQELIKETEGAF